MVDHMPHAVVGSDFAEKEVGELTDEIYERLGIRIETTELYEDGKRVLVLSVPSRPVGRLLRYVYRGKPAGNVRCRDFQDIV